MNPSEAQPESDSAATYFDPEELDTSEEKFSASLEPSFDLPRFVVDDEGIPGGENRAFSHADDRSKELSGTSDNRSFSKEAAERRSEEILPANPSAATDSAPDWRDQVSAKVNHYKARKPQKDRYPSLRLPFEPEIRE